MSFILDRIEKIGVQKEDPDRKKIQKSTLVGSTILISIAGLIWSLIYFYLGFIISAIIPFSYAIFSFFNIYIFDKRKDFSFFRNTQLILILLLPFVLMISLGGFESSSAVILWSILGPLGALTFADYRKAPYWFSMYLLLLIISTVLEFSYDYEIAVTEDIRIIFFLLNIAGVSTILFFIVYYFVGERNKAFELLSELAEREFSTLINDLDLEERKSIDNVSEPVLFMIINQGGLAIYSQILTEAESFDNQLISGFLTAINSFSKEAFGTNFLKEITYKEFQLMFDIIDGLRIVYASRGNSLDAKRKFQNFINEFQRRELSTLIPDRDKGVKDETVIDKIIETTLLSS